MSLIQREGLKFFQDTLEEMNGVLDFENYSYKVFPELLKISERHYEFTNTFEKITKDLFGIEKTTNLNGTQRELIANELSKALETEVGAFSDGDKLQMRSSRQNNVTTWKDFVLFLLDSQTQISEFKNRETLIKLFFGIVACGGTVEDCDELASVSGVQGRGVRSLYQLDLREGFLRFVLYWNEAVGVGDPRHITYMEAIKMLPDVEGELKSGAERKLEVIDHLFVSRNLPDAKEESEFAKLRNRTENIRSILNSGKTIDLSAVHSELGQILKRLAMVDDNGNIQSDDCFQQATKVMNEGTKAWENAIQSIAENYAEDGYEFDTAKEQYIIQAIESIGERNLTAMSVIVSAINNPDRYERNLSYFASSYNLSSRRERGITPTERHLRLSRALDPAEVLKTGNLNAIEMMMNPRLCTLRSRDGTIFISNSHLPAGESRIPENLANHCTIFDSKFENGMVVKTKRKSLIRFALAAGFSKVSEVEDVLGLSGDRYFNLNDKTEAFVLMVLVYLEHLGKKDVCVLDYMRQAEVLLMRFLAQKNIDSELKDFELGAENEEPSNIRIDNALKTYNKIVLYDRPSVLEANRDEYDRFCMSFYMLASGFSLLLGENMRDACEQTICSTEIGDVEDPFFEIDEDSFRDDFTVIIDSEGNQVDSILALVNIWTDNFLKYVNSSIFFIDEPVIELFAVMTNRGSNLCDYMRIVVEELRKRNRTREADTLSNNCDLIESAMETLRSHLDRILEEMPED